MIIRNSHKAEYLVLITVIHCRKWICG